MKPLQKLQKLVKNYFSQKWWGSLAYLASCSKQSVF